MNLRHISLTILLSAAIYIILTLPYLTLIYFNVGIKYSMSAILICALISALVSPHLAKHKIFN